MGELLHYSTTFQNEPRRVYYAAISEGEHDMSDPVRVLRNAITHVAMHTEGFIPRVTAITLLVQLYSYAVADRTASEVFKSIRERGRRPWWDSASSAL